MYELPRQKNENLKRPLLVSEAADNITRCSYYDEKEKEIIRINSIEKPRDY